MEVAAAGALATGVGSAVVAQIVEAARALGGRAGTGHAGSGAGLADRVCADAGQREFSRRTWGAEICRKGEHVVFVTGQAVVGTWAAAGLAGGVAGFAESVQVKIQRQFVVVAVIARFASVNASPDIVSLEFQIADVAGGRVSASFAVARTYAAVSGVAQALVRRAAVFALCAKVVGGRAPGALTR